MLFQGTLDRSWVHPREIFRWAVVYGCASIIVAHNHPSGLAVPSAEDIQTTRQIAQALRAVEIALADHIVVADDDYVSIAMSDERFNQCLLI